MARVSKTCFTQILSLALVSMKEMPLLFAKFFIRKSERGGEREGERERKRERVRKGGRDWEGGEGESV